VQSQRTFEFELLFRFPEGVEDYSDEMVDRHYEAGCADALVGISCGEPYIAFAREAPSFRVALISAIADVEKSGAELELIGVKMLEAD
jgi:hypothetical protein